MEMKTEDKYSEVINSIRNYFDKRTIACPDFFHGSLRDACRAAFSSPTIQEHCPVLVYIHHDKSIIYIESFCSLIRSSKSIKNYIVWPWNVTSKSNRQPLKNMWNELLLDLPSDSFSRNICPMLIGIRRCLRKKTVGIILSEYEYEILFRGDSLGSAGNRSSVQEILDRLTDFKQKSDQHEEVLAFDFIGKTRLSWDVVLEITKYLTLNDAITVFSDKVLLLLNQYKIKLQVLNPTVPLIKTIGQQMSLENIISVRVETKTTTTNKFDYHSLADLKKIRSLTLRNSYEFKQFEQYQSSLPELHRLSLYYDQVFPFQLLEYLFESIKIPIKRLDIRFTEMHCTPFLRNLSNNSIEYVVIDISDLVYRLKSENCSGSKYKFHTELGNLLEHMPNIRHFRLIIKPTDFDQVLERKRWRRLLLMCKHLENIRIQVVSNCLHEDVLSQVQDDVEFALKQTRDSVKFQFIY